MKKKFFLVCSNLKDTFPKKKNLTLYLGYWCLNYKNKNFRNKSNIVAPYHWNNVKKFENDADYIKSVYEIYLRFFSNYLNKYHKVNYSIRCWRILVGPWLKLFISALYDRWQMIKFVEKKYPINSKIILKIKEENLIFDNLINYLNEIQEDWFNEVIYSEIIKKFSSIAYKESNKLISQSVKKKKSFKNKIIDIIIRLYNFIVFFFFSNKYILIFSTISYKSIFFLNFYLKQFPIFLTKDLTKQKPIKLDIDWSARLSPLKVFKKDIFFEILNYMLIKYIPKSYLENFDKLNDFFEYKYLNNKKKIFIVGDIYTSDIFKKIIVESIKKNKSKLYILQHGGLYFFSKTMHYQQHELKICDKYLAFGKNNLNKVIKFYNVKLLGKKLLKSSNKHDILFIQVNCSKYFHSDLVSSIFSGRFIKYFNNQVIFVKKLKVNLRKKLVIRYPDYNIKWQENLRWKNQFRNLKIDYGKLPLISVLNDFKICVVSYNGTTMLETLSLNFPTIIFWDHKIENLDKRGLYYINILRSVGIFFDSAQAASEKINKIYKNVDLWWNTQKVQEARKIFCNQYSYVDDNKNYKALSNLIKNYD